MGKLRLSDGLSVEYGSLDIDGNIVWHAGNDASGSGLDADLLDGQQGTHYLNYNNFTNTPTIPTNNNQLTNGAGYITGSGTANQSHMVSGSAFATTSSPGSVLEYQQASGQTDTKLAPSTDWHNTIRMGHGNPYSYYSNTLAMQMTGTGAGRIRTQLISNNSAQGWRIVWDSGNDGSGSGLDADLLDGQHGSYYLDYNNFTNTPSASSNADTLDSLDSTQFLRSDADDSYGSTSANRYIRFNCNSGQYIASGGSSSRFPIEIFAPTANGGDAGLTFHISNDYAGFFGLASDWNDLAWGGWSVGSSTKYRIWHSGNDGSGSGLDADTLDGVQASGFVVTSGTTQTVGTGLTFTGGITFNNTVTANSHIYGRSVNNDYSHLYRFGGLFFTWDSDSYGTAGNHSIRSTYGDTFGDEITLNSYNHLRFNIDTNNNDSTSYFEVGHHTTGTGNILMRLTSPSGNLEVDGNITAYSTSISDIKYKDNIEPLEGSLDKILQLQGVEFDWTATRRKGMRDIGFIAQEVEPIVPQVVSEHQNGIGEFSQNEETSKSIAYDKLVPLLVESIKEQQNQINELKALINNLMEEK